MYVTYTRIYGWSDYGGESSYQPGYRLENMMWMTLLVYDYIIPGENENEKRNDSHFHSCPNCYVFIITNKRSIINYLLKEQTAETQATLYLLLRIRVV